MRAFLIALTRSPISLAGAAITTAAGVLIVSLFSIELIGVHATPYIGILTYLILPAIFILGLILIPIGIAVERRRARKAEAEGRKPPLFPVIDMNRARTRMMVLIFVVLTSTNLVILATATYKGVEVMESTEFCGQACHSVMQPEFTAYSRSPHSRVKCVDCHIGPGASWFVKSKLSGAWQVVSVAFDLYPRPIPTPIHNLRPARETCEQCHWPTKFVGERLWVKTTHAEDETNTEQKTVLLMRIGGQQGRTSHGIHWHVDPGVQIRYRSDESRETIHEIELSQDGGETKRFLAPEAEAGGVWRDMDCIDCHNRPTHVYRTPQLAIDTALNEGRLPTDLPFLRREGVQAIQADYASHAEAATGIETAIREFYATSYPEIAAARASDVTAAGQELARIFATNVFPSMNVGWGTYPNHIGHENSPGCFRCHSDEHATEAGEVISQDCELCHSVLAWEEEDPEILRTLNP